MEILNLRAFHHSLQVGLDQSPNMNPVWRIAVTCVITKSVECMKMVYKQNQAFKVVAPINIQSIISARVNVILLIYIVFAVCGEAVQVAVRW